MSRGRPQLATADDVRLLVVHHRLGEEDAATIVAALAKFAREADDAGDVVLAAVVADAIQIVGGEGG